VIPLPWRGTGQITSFCLSNASKGGAPPCSRLLVLGGFGGKKVAGVCLLFARTLNRARGPKNSSTTGFRVSLIARHKARAGEIYF